MRENDDTASFDKRSENTDPPGNCREIIGAINVQDHWRRSLHIPPMHEFHRNGFSIVSGEALGKYSEMREPNRGFFKGGRGARFQIVPMQAGCRLIVTINKGKPIRTGGDKRLCERLKPIGSTRGRYRSSAGERYLPF